MTTSRPTSTKQPVSYTHLHTIKVAIDPATRPSDLARPGHMFPLRARKGGVLVRAGQTEASVDLARLAGMVPAGIICEDVYKRQRQLPAT